MSIKNVILIGAGGALGAPVFEALRKSFNVTVLTRKSSTAKFGSDVRVVSVSDDYPVDELAEAFKGQDAVVSTIGDSSLKLQHNFIDAAVQAKVKRFIPAEFGADTTDPETWELAPSIWGVKHGVTEHIKSKESDGLTWTVVVTGMFFDWAFQKTQGKFLHLDLEKRTALLQDDGEHKFSMTNMDRIGEAIARILQKPEETKNKHVFIQSFLVTQNQLIQALEKQLGGKRFEVTKIDNKKLLAESSAKLRSDPHDVPAIANTIFAYIVSHGNNSLNPGYGNALLGLKDEDFEGSLKKELAGIGH